MMSGPAEPDTSQLFQNFYSYYSHDPNGSSEQQTTYPSKLGQTNAAGEPALVRVHETQRSNSSFPPPPSHSGASSGLQHRHQKMGYGGHVPISVRRQPNHYPVTSPVAMSTPSLTGDHNASPPHSYHRSPGLPGRYVSPGVHLLSPSHTTNLILPGITASKGCSSSTSYSGSRNTLALVAANEQGFTSWRASQSESWDGGEGEFTTGTMGRTGSETEPDDQSWRMPQEYKALSPRDKKQIRNRIGARRFRAKRKEYVNNLEQSLRARDEECTALRIQVDTQRHEIDDLRRRLGLPLMQPTDTELGQVGPNSE